ncbi:glycerate kinase [Lacticaseibacillus parakribbianus]|uniref:glycerate kinase n=1 Tax=Lacticaseibacillus parakribbianus TaxID=2970927 RepID=UPI0021CB62CE|nr:glycerate kinase [Lacticaseibacillus parakribbianus]
MAPLHIVVAIDSFKGSATSLQAATWVAEGIRRVQPDAAVSPVPIADGGEGTVVALTTALNGRLIQKTVTGPLAGQRVSATFGMLDAETAVVEMAQASGLNLTSQESADALRASTYGVGELIEAALDEGAKVIYVGLGGSATTDGGVGMAKALGVSFQNAQGQPIPCGAQGLSELATIDVRQLDSRLQNVSVRLLSDVTNPLYGKKGAAAIYGPQKGLTKRQIPAVEKGLAHYAELLSQVVGRDIAHRPGAGAAGGLGAGLMAFTNAEVFPGIDAIRRLVGLDRLLVDADLVITGEGKMDAQSLNGKAPIGIARAAKRYGVPVVALVGARSADLAAVYAAGIDALWAVGLGPESLQEAIAHVQENLTCAGETVMRAFLLNKKGD